MSDGELSAGPPAAWFFGTKQSSRQRDFIISAGLVLENIQRFFNLNSREEKEKLRF